MSLKVSVTSSSSSSTTSHDRDRTTQPTYTPTHRTSHTFTTVLTTPISSQTQTNRGIPIHTHIHTQFVETPHCRIPPPARFVQSKQYRVLFHASAPPTADSRRPSHTWQIPNRSQLAWIAECRKHVLHQHNPSVFVAHTRTGCVFGATEIHTVHYREGQAR